LPVAGLKVLQVGTSPDFLHDNFIRAQSLFVRQAVCMGIFQKIIATRMIIITITDK
jgi:hypothetical protein